MPSRRPWVEIHSTEPLRGSGVGGGRYATESNGTAPFNLSNLLWNAGRPTDAITANRLAVQINPNDRD